MASHLSRALYMFMTQTTHPTHTHTRAVEYTVFCRLAPLQKAIYRAIVREKMKVALETGRRDDALSSITMLKKLCNHPSLVYSMCQVCTSPSPRKYTRGCNFVYDFNKGCPSLVPAHVPLRAEKPRGEQSHPRGLPS